jgi:hypothetical protein
MGGGYYYFETPDYDNCAGKVWWGAKYSAGLSASIATLDILFETRVPKTFEFVTGRYIRYIVPWTTSLMLGASVACSLSNLRGKKDDSWNYFWGGAATGLIWTKFFRCSGKGAASGFVAAVAGSLFKQAHEHDFVILPYHIPGATAYYGAGAGDEWADLRIPGLIWTDPGRRPQ